MKKIIFLLFLISIIVKGYPQFSGDSTELVKRLETFMQHNRDLDFDKLMNYVYPQVFTLASRDQMIQAMEAAFKNPELAMKMDSLRIERIYPVFAIGNSRYAKVLYSMRILMTPGQVGDSVDINGFLALMQEQFGKENVRLHENLKTLIIKQQLAMAAIKDDSSKEWTFLNMKDGDPIMEKLLEKSVLDKLNAY